MKRSISAILAVILVLSCLALASCKNEEPGKTVTIGDESITFPSGVENVTQSLPESLNCYFTDSDGTVYDLYKEDVDTLKNLSQHSHETTYSSLEDKQDIADISAAIFAELYPEKEVVYEGANLTIKANVAAKALICCGKGNDGGYAALAIEKATGEVIMILYSAPQRASE